MTLPEELAALQAELTVHARRLDTIIRRIEAIKLRLEQPTTQNGFHQKRVAEWDAMHNQ